jgi:hypothetical protein
MKIVKQLSNKVKSIATGVSTFIPTQLSFWYGGQYVTNETMNTFSKDLYEKLALLTTNVNNFPAVIFSDGGISKFTITSDKKFIDLPALACAFQLQDTQGNNLPYKPYVIGYIDKQRVVISTGTLTNVLYVYSSINISDIDPKPTNAPTPMQLVALTTTPDNNKDKCLLCIIKTDGSIDFSQTNFLVNSAVTTTGNTELLNPQNKINAITPQALSLFSNLGHVDAFDERVRANGGYAKGSIIREREGDISWVYYQSLIDNNMNDKPNEDSHVGWLILNMIYIDPDIENRVSQIFPSNAKNGIYTETDGESYSVLNDETFEVSVLKENLLKFEVFKPEISRYVELMKLTTEEFMFRNKDEKVTAFYSQYGSQAPFYAGDHFKDINMDKVIGNITRYGTESGSTKNRILTLSNGTIISMHEGFVLPNQETTLGYANSIQFKEIPFVIAVPNDCILPDFTQMPITWRITEQTTGHVSIRTKTDPNVTYCGFVVIAIGTLASYVGNELSKIRSYKVTPYYNKLNENQKQELDQYYIGLDEAKDLTKVTAPEWLKAELEGKELA